MYRLTVLYGHPEDPREFQRYYREVHLPLASKMKGLQGWTIGLCESTDPAQAPPYYMIVGLYAETAPQWRPSWHRQKARPRWRTFPISQPAAPSSCMMTKRC